MFRGFFNRMYNGNPNKPDINPEDMPKNRFELFFTTLGLRFGDLIKLNLLFVLTILPLILWTIWSVAAMTIGFYNLSDTLKHTASALEQTQFLTSSLFTYLIILPVVLVLAGPPLAGLTYIARNYARDEHVWLWSDFKEQMKKNWKQSVAVMLILGVVLFLAFYTLYMYSYAIQMSEWLWVLRLIFIVFVCLFLSSYMYVFPMLVTYKARVGQILKNSLMLAVGRLPFTIFFGLLSLFPLLLGMLLSYYFPTIQNYVLLVMMIYYLLLGFSLTAFIMNSYTNATFDKLLKADDETPPPDDGDREVKP